MKFLSLLVVFTATLIATSARAEWVADSTNKVEVKAKKALVSFQEKAPRTTTYFEQAYGYAIYPSVTRIGFGFGGAYGKGLVVEGDVLIGTSKYKQFTSGIQAGARNFSMIVFFKDKEALDKFKAADTQFMGQAGLAVGTVGIAGTPAYNDGVAVVTITNFGLMGEFTISGARFSYKADESR